MFLSNEGCRGFLRSTGRRYKESSTCYCAEGFPPRGRNSAAIVLLAEGACSTDSRAIPKCKPTEMPPSFGTCLCRMLLPPVCVSIQPPLLSGQRLGRETLRARWVGAASCWQSLSGGLLSPACQAPWQLPATTCKQPPRTLLFVPRCHGMGAPTWSEESVWLHAAPWACERL